MENRSRKLLESKVDRISFLKVRYFASFVTNRPFAANHSRDTKPPYWKASEAGGQGIVYLCELLRLLYHSFCFYASLSSLWYCHFLLVKLCNCNMRCVNKWLLKKDKKEITILNYISLLFILSQCFGLVLRWWPAAKCPFSTNWLFINVLRVCFDCRFITA